MLLRALADNIDKYESRFGEINVDFQQEPAFGFPPPKTEKFN